MPSKNQNPREGIETILYPMTDASLTVNPSKNQNPREGIETPNYIAYLTDYIPQSLQKTKIPARGLKPSSDYLTNLFGQPLTSKNQNPREGIET